MCPTPTQMVLSNPGGEPLVWELSTDGIAALSVSPTNGTVDPQDIAILTVTFASESAHAQAAPYEGTITVSAVSGVCICRSQQATVSVSVGVSATADAAMSEVVLHNADTIVASSSMTFNVIARDSTGMIIKDAIDVVFSARAILPAGPTSARRLLQAADFTDCALAYSVDAGMHVGSCKLPELVTGEFSLEVTDAAGAPVGGGSSAFSVGQCPVGYYLDKLGACAACSANKLDCSSAGANVQSLLLLPGWYRIDASTDKIRECPGGHLACEGGRAVGDESCARGHSGPMCSIW